MKKLLLIWMACASAGALFAQTPSDAMMMEKRESCFALIYENAAFDQYWEGTSLRKNETIATVSRRTVMPMIAIGVMDKLNFYIGVPHVRTESSEPNGGKFQGAKGFQDLTLALKYQFLNVELVSAKLSVFGAAGYATPITNYLSDYRPYSIGNGTNEWSLRGIAEYKLDMGFYARIAGAHLFRGQTKAERDYYYNNGSYYTPWMDVPSAWEYNAVAGIWLLDNALKFEANFYALKSTSGDDIRKYNAAQPTNKVQFDQLGVSAQYFVKSVKGFGVLAYYSHVLNGRNIPKSTAIGAGLTYQFKI
jgi:hypothetical protein